MPVLADELECDQVFFSLNVIVTFDMLENAEEDIRGKVVDRVRRQGEGLGRRGSGGRSRDAFPTPPWLVRVEN